MWKTKGNWESKDHTKEGSMNNINPQKNDGARLNDPFFLKEHG